MSSLVNQAIENNIDDFKILKKHYGERFAKLCRNLFPTILEEKGALSKIILSKFAPSRFLYEDLVDYYATERFKNFIYSFYLKENYINYQITETPEQLFDKAGYTLYKCETDEDVQGFKKYFADGEKLCTFKDPNRIKTHTIFFAIKKNVDEIKRENFKTPRRQDEYGTSVISLQFTKGKRSTLSIKNRYNHTVDNPDATFSNDLENIYPGLTDSFYKYYNIQQIDAKHNFELPSYVKAKDGKYYRYNYEINNTYYCPNNMIIHNSEPRYYDSRRYDVIDYFIIDKQRKTIVNPNATIKDEFEKIFTDSWGNSHISKIEISKIQELKKFVFTLADNNKITITVDKYNRITEYHDAVLATLPESFLYKNTTLKILDTPNVIHISNHALNYNTSIKKLYLPKVETIENNVMFNNPSLEEIYLPNLRFLGKYSFYHTDSVTKLNLPKLETMEGNNFAKADKLLEFIAPLLEQIGICCLSDVKNLKFVDIGNLKKLENRCLHSANALTDLEAPNLRQIDTHCLSDCNSLETLQLPKLKEIGSYCFYNSDNLTRIDLPKLILILDNSFKYCDNLKVANLPRLKQVGENCFVNIKSLETIKAPYAFKHSLKAKNKTISNQRSL